MKRVMSILFICALLVFAGLALAQESLNVRKLGQLSFWDRARNVVVVGNIAYVATNSSGLRILDITNPAHPIEVGFYDTPGSANDVAKWGDFAYVADGNSGLRIVNISNPTAPYEVGFYDASESLQRIKVRGNYAYVICGSGLRIIDITDPSMPVEAALYNSSSAKDVALSGDYAFVANGYNGLLVLNISNPSLPEEVGSYASPSLMYRVVIEGNYAYVIDTYYLRIINIANPASPFLVGLFQHGYEAEPNVTVAENHAYIGGWSNAFRGLKIVNIANPSLPVETGFCATPGMVFGMAARGDYVYVADGDEGGLRIVDVTDHAMPEEVGFYQMSGEAWGVTVSDDYMYVIENYMGIYGYYGNLRVFDISSRMTPIEVGSYQMSDMPRAAVISGNYCYLAFHNLEYNGGLRILDIANPSAPVEVGEIILSGLSAYAVAVRGNYAYVACGSRIYIFNVADPSSPSMVGFFDILQGSVRSMTISGNELFVATGFLAIFDISNPTSPVETGSNHELWSANDVAISGNHAYVADNFGVLWVVNIDNLSLPIITGYCFLPAPARAVSLSNGYAYVADYDSGLRVVNVTDPAAPYEVGFYDTPGFAYDVVAVENFAYIADFLYIGFYEYSAAMGDPCVGDLSVTLTPNNPNFPSPQNVSACARIVPGLFTQVVVPVSNSTNIPTVTVTAGCASDPGCTPAEGWNLAQPWQYDANTTSFFTTISRVGEGCCVTLSLDYVLPVELLGFDAVPGDAQVLLRWQTASETGSDHFEIERAGVFVHQTPAVGDATGHSYSWTDRTVSNGQSYHYTLWAVETNGERNLLSETDATPRAGIAEVTEYALHGNYPNPFNPTTEIAFDLPEAGNVSLKVFDLMGREVAVLVNGEKPAGQHTVSFDARDLPSGVYICRMNAGSFSASQKMMLIR